MPSAPTRRILDRRRFLAGLGSLLVLPRLARGAGRRPPFDNLVLVGVDDLNDWLSCLRGHPNARTPNLDRIAAEGVLFSDCHAAAPICNPSRTATYFGLLPSTSGVYFNAQDWRGSSVLLGRPSLFNRLRQAGLRSDGIGKVHHKDFVDRSAWDHFWPSVDEPRPEERFPIEAVPKELENVKGLRWGELDAEQEALYPIADTEIAEAARRKLGRFDRLDRRFSLAVGFGRPHVPWIVPKRYWDLFPLEEVKPPFALETDDDDLPRIARRLARGDEDHRRILNQGLWPRATQAYLAAIAFADEQVGRVFDAYRAMARAERTVFVFWSDNGWHMGEKGLWRKAALWREATRVPLMIVAPGLARRGGVCRRPVSLVALYATICELLGLAPPDDLEGSSLVPQLRDPEAPRAEPALSFLGRNTMALRDERWCYIRYGDGGEELYDRARDPREFQNLAPAKDAAFLAALRARLPPKPWPYDPKRGQEEGREIGVDD